MERQIVLAAGILAAGLAQAAGWPLVTMRQMTSTTFRPETVKAMLDIHARHRGAVDEFWFAEGVARNPEAMTNRAAVIAGYRDACRAAGIVCGFQQGVTLGHDFTKCPADAWALPDDAWQADRNGRRAWCPCPRSPDVLKMEETYAETYVRLAGLDSYWLDDDLRFGFYKRGLEACWCDRCLKALNDRAGTSFTRAEAVERLVSDKSEDPLRAVWAEVRAEGLALFAAAAARGARRANPDVRLAYQAISSATINCGEDNRAILSALSDGGRHAVGIRPGHGYYDEDCDAKRELVTKLLDVAREAERCRALPGWSGQVCYEQENYPHYVMQKTPGAIVVEAAAALAAGCDAVALYWYGAEHPEPLSYYEELVTLAGAWRPYWARLAELAKATHLGGVARRPDKTLMTGPKASAQALAKDHGATVRRDPNDVTLALAGVPVTVWEAGVSNFYSAAHAASLGHHYRVADRAAVLDELDRGEPGGVCVRIDKVHPLVVWPRIDANGRTRAVTVLNVSIGRARNLPVCIRRPSGRRATLLRPCADGRPLAAASVKDGADALTVELPDLGAWEIATVLLDRGK